MHCTGCCTTSNGFVEDLVEVAGGGEMNLNNKIDALGVGNKELEKFTDELKPGVKGKERLGIVGNLICSLRERIEGSTGHIEGRELSHLEDELERCHITLDTIDIDDIEAKQMRRIQSIKVSNLLNLLDSEAAANAVEECQAEGVGYEARGNGVKKDERDKKQLYSRVAKFDGG